MTNEGSISNTPIHSTVENDEYFVASYAPNQPQNYNQLQLKTITFNR